MTEIEPRTEQVTLHLEGPRAVRGVSLSDFENFIESFLAALRDFDRGRRGAETKKSGRPYRRDEAVTAFRLVDFKPGSGIATLEPEHVGAPDSDDPLFEERLPSLTNLHALVHDIEEREPLPDPVTDALERACRTFGSQGSIEVELPSGHYGHKTEITPKVLEEIRARTGRPAPKDVEAISGRLHLLDVEPDKIAIRDASGVDWVCQYPEEMEPKVLGLAGKIVWAHGQGRQTSPQRGAMTIDEIKAVEQGDQASLFTPEPVGLERLIEEQGVRYPQELGSLGSPEWTDEDEAFLSALTED